jgi:uncharacterized membrane protein
LSILITLIWMWLVVGFVSGVKLIFIDKTITNELLQELYDQAKTEHDKKVIVMASKKRNVLAICTLLGFIVLYFDTLGMIKETKREVEKLKEQYKNKK